MGYYTKEGFKKLRNSLDVLRLDYEQKMSELITDNKDGSIGYREFIQGRFNINYSYSNERSKIITNLNNAVIIEDTDDYKNWDGTTVSRKCKVTIDYNGDSITYKILGANEADVDNDILSCNAPIVEAMLGRKIGDFIDFNGDTIFIEDINSVESELIEYHNEVITKRLRQEGK